jgi:hypothetical protein
MKAEYDLGCRFAKGLKLNECFLDGKDITPRIEKDIINAMGRE